MNSEEEIVGLTGGTVSLLTKHLFILCKVVTCSGETIQRFDGKCTILKVDDREHSGKNHLIFSVFFPFNTKLLIFSFIFAVLGFNSGPGVLTRQVLYHLTPAGRGAQWHPGETAP
jgi:hypothetical protein